MGDLKRIDFDSGILIGKSGKKYITKSSLSVERYTWFQLYEKELAYNLTLKGMHDKLIKLYELNNKMKFADAAVLINDMIRGVSKMGERQPVIMKICCLYINAEDEDESVINQDVIDAKINDWKEYDIADFFALAMRSVHGLIEIYQSVILTISEMPVMEIKD